MQPPLFTFKFKISFKLFTSKIHEIKDFKVQISDPIMHLIIFILE